jgi:outer membrane protein assembly factor BamB
VHRPPTTRLKPAALLLPALLLPTLLSPGCATKQPAPSVVTEVAAESFSRHWRAILPAELGTIKQLHLTENSVLAFVGPPAGGKGYIYVLSRSSGTTKFAVEVDQIDQAGAPILLNDTVILPILNTLHVYSPDGTLLRTIPVPGARRGNIATDGTLVYVPADTRDGPRLLAIDPASPVVTLRWQLMSRGALSSRPATATTENGPVIYFASEDGAVTAITQDRKPHWQLPGSTFHAGAAITADLVADPDGVYAASTDTKLYRLAASTGKIAWQYFAEQPLSAAPILLGNTVFQQVPRQGLVSIPANEGKFNRLANWNAPAATQFLSADDKYVYVRLRGNSLGALSRKTGQLMFKSQRSDLDVFIPNTKDATIYAATSKGEILAIKPILRPGLTGELVLQTTPTENAPAYGG